MQNRKVCFWLYNGEQRVTGLYGALSQFTDEPKIYTLSDAQVETVFSNLVHKIKRLRGEESVDSVPVLDMLVQDADSVAKSINFDNVRIYTTDDELVSVHQIIIGDDVVIERNQ